MPIAAVGLLFKEEIEGEFTKNLWVIAVMLIAVALLLVVAEVVGTRRRTTSDLSLRDAIIVGFAQVLALIPGASRAGSTIMGGMFAGQTRETAARFSFLLSIPAIAASGLLELKEAWKTPGGKPTACAGRHGRIRRHRLPLYLVHAQVPAHTLDRRLHLLTPDPGRGYFSLAGIGKNNSSINQLKSVLSYARASGHIGSGVGSSRASIWPAISSRVERGGTSSRDKLVHSLRV